MGRPVIKHRLSKAERRELARMNRTRASVSDWLGRKSEEEAGLICQEFQQAGFLEKFWPIPQHSVLDLRGVDTVCKTPRGYFLINIKKSSAGVNSFKQARERMLRAHDARILPIYPWRVMLEVSRRQEVEAELNQILNCEPSFTNDSLPEEIRLEMENPTYPSKEEKPVKSRVREKPTAAVSVIERVKQLKKDGRVQDLRLEPKKVWQIRLTAVVDGSRTEIIKYGSRNEAERAAYEELLAKI